MAKCNSRGSPLLLAFGSMATPLANVVSMMVAPGGGVGLSTVITTSPDSPGAHGAWHPETVALSSRGGSGVGSVASEAFAPGAHPTRAPPTNSTTPSPRGKRAFVLMRLPRLYNG